MMRALLFCWEDFRPLVISHRVSSGYLSKMMPISMLKHVMVGGEEIEGVVVAGDAVGDFVGDGVGLLVG